MATRAERRAEYERHIEAAEAKGQSLYGYAQVHRLSIETLNRHRRPLREEQTKQCLR